VIGEVKSALIKSVKFSLPTVSDCVTCSITDPMDFSTA
jgi:hypothetical protein